MEIVLLTAFGVGGATVIGALIGLLFKKQAHKFSDIVLAFASGVMLAAAVMGLVIPSIEKGATLGIGNWSILVTIAGIFLGAGCLTLIDRFVPHNHEMFSDKCSLAEEKHLCTERMSKVFLFVLAIAIHNFPEGVAAGVGFGAGDTPQALIIAGGIALQNIPEGLVIIGPMLAVGVSKKKTLLYASLTGLVEVVGTLIGYFAISISTVILPLLLSFAGGTMLYIISDEMIPETHSHGSQRGATYALLIGFVVMLCVDFLLG